MLMSCYAMPDRNGILFQNLFLCDYYWYFYYNFKDNRGNSVLNVGNGEKHQLPKNLNDETLGWIQEPLDVP